MISDAPARAIPKSVTRPGEHDVARLEIAVDDAAVVRVLHAGQHLAHDLDRLTHRQTAFDQVLERGPFDVLHRDVVGAVHVPAIEDADHVGVLEPRGGGGLPPKPLHELLVLRKARMQELQRYPSVEHRVLGAPDVGHSAGAEPSQQPVAAGDDRVVRELHQPEPSAASITCVTTGPATSAPKHPWHRSMVAATAILGS